MICVPVVPTKNSSIAMEKSEIRKVSVAVGVIVDSNSNILLSLRPPHVNFGNLWEFPGGKIEPGENPYAALKRELQEELNITVSYAQPLINFKYFYPESIVDFNVYLVNQFDGNPIGAEGQQIAWYHLEQIKNLPLPEANKAIINALQLPATYLITGELETNNSNFLQRLEKALQRGSQLIQLRVNNIPAAAYYDLAETVLSLCQRYQTKLLLNTDVATFQQINAHGLHLNSQRLLTIQQRPIDDKHLLSASCHNIKEIEHAHAIGVDLIVLGPVKQTASHPHAETLTWQRFQELVAIANVPVYAIGGMTLADIDTVKQHGGHGIAGISALW